MGIDVDGLDEAIEFTDDIARAIEDPSEALILIAQRAREFTAERFATRTSPDGRPWAPLKRPSESSGATAESIYAVPGNSMIAVGATSEAAGPQHLGTRTIPARPFLPDGAVDAGPAAALYDEAAEALAAHVVQEG